MNKIKATSQPARAALRRSFQRATLKFPVWRLSARPLLFILISLLLAPWIRAQEHTDYAFGADLSFLKELEDKGVKFKDQGIEKPGLQIFRDHGYNWVRLRVCVEPVSRGLPNDLAYTIACAKDAKARGFKFLLDFHYSNDWSDPTNEPTPLAWRELSKEALVDRVFTYTRDTIAALRDAGVLPEMVQIGNEVSNGTLWPLGKLPENWDTFAGLIYAGVNGVDAGRGNFRRPKIMIHLDHGGDRFLTERFFEKFNSYGIPYDVVGFSFYPWSHGTLLDLRDTLRFAAEVLGKEVMVVETGYYWKPSQYFKNSPPPFPETPEGQRAWFEAVNAAVMATPLGRGRGVFWWEPAGPADLVERGFFDHEHNALPIVEAFHSFTRPAKRVDGQHAPQTPPEAVRFGAAP